MWGKARWKLQKNATCCFEQILEAASHKTAAVQPLEWFLKWEARRTRHGGYCWRTKNKLITNILLWTHRCWPTSKILCQLCADTECSLENLPRAMDDRDSKRESGKSMLSAQLYDVHLTYTQDQLVHAEISLV